MLDLRINPKQKRALVIISTLGLGLNTVLTAFNVTVLNDFLVTKLFGPVTLGVVLGAGAVLSGWMLITKQM